MDLVLSRSFDELIHIVFWVHRQFRGHFWHLLKLVGLVLSRSYMSHCILFWGPSTVSRAFLVVMKTRYLDLSRSFMSYCILFFGVSTISRAFLAFIKTSGFGPFSQFYELLHTVLGSVDSFEGISDIPEKDRKSVV